MQKSTYLPQPSKRKNIRTCTGHVRVRVVKNKVAPPFKVAEFDIIYGKGISKSGEIVDIGVELGIIGKSGSWFSYNGEKIAQGKDNLKKTIESNPALLEEIEAKIKAKSDDIDLSAGEAYSLDDDDDEDDGAFDLSILDVKADE